MARGGRVRRCGGCEVPWDRGDGYADLAKVGGCYVLSCGGSVGHPACVVGSLACGMTQTKAQEFEALIHGPNTTLDVIKWTQRNVSLIARALRRDEAIESVDTSKVFTDKMLVGVAQASGLEYNEPIIADVLVAFRKALP